MGRPARPLHDAGNDRSIERRSDLQAARRGSLTTPAKPAVERENTAALTPSPGTRSLPDVSETLNPAAAPATGESPLTGKAPYESPANLTSTIMVGAKSQIISIRA